MFDISKGGKKRRRLSASLLMNILMYFGGGVLLAVSFIHLIPEVRSNFDNYFKSHNLSAPEVHEHDHDHEDHDHNETDLDDDHDHASHEHAHEHSHGIPYVEFAICGGFFFIYLLEEVVHTFIGHDHDEDDEEEHNQPDRIRRSDSSESGVSSGSSADYSAENGGHHHRQLRNNLALEPASLLAAGNKKRETSIESLDKGAYTNYGIDIDLKHETGIGGGHHQQPTHYPIFHTQSVEPLFRPGSVTPPKLSISLPGNKPLLPASIRFAKGLVVIAAFSAHSVFDGVAIGLQESSNQIWTMFFAICVHKLVVAFAVGLELLEKTSSLVITSALMGLFSLMSPIGILIVILTESSIKEGDSPVVILLSAVATGTILYIVFFEILQRDRAKDSSKITGFVLFVAMIVGFAVMSSITLFIVH